MITVFFYWGIFFFPSVAAAVLVGQGLRKVKWVMTQFAP